MGSDCLSGSYTDDRTHTLTPTAAQTDLPHLRIFLTLTNLYCPSVDVLDSTLTRLCNELNPSHADGHLLFSHIRAATLRVPYLLPTYRYLPRSRLEASIGDIGYVRGDHFIKLDSMASELHGGIGCVPNHTVASGPIVSEMTEDGVLV